MYQTISIAFISILGQQGSSLHIYNSKMIYSGIEHYLKNRSTTLKTYQELTNAIVLELF